jgi:hypothetical protein
MTNKTQQLIQPTYKYLTRIETDNQITMSDRLIIPGRRLIYVITELGWQDQLFLPIRLQLIDETQTSNDE